MGGGPLVVLPAFASVLGCPVSAPGTAVSQANVVSPILLRPIREQFEHDRIIRQLQVRWRRRFGVAVNPGAEREHSVKCGGRLFYPDLVLTINDSRNRLHGVVEVETMESVNNLEAMAEWTMLAKVRGHFYLYVPSGSADVALRLCQENKVQVNEIWSYYTIGSQVRFLMTYRSSSTVKNVRRAKLAKVKAAKKKVKASKPLKKIRKSVRKKTASVKSRSKSKSKS